MTALSYIVKSVAKPNPISDYWTSDFENTRILLGELHNWKIRVLYAYYGKNKFFLLPNFAKIVEKVVSNRLTHFLETNSLLCQEQFGFRKAHSTLHPLIHFLNNISKAKSQKQILYCNIL